MSGMAYHPKYKQLVADIFLHTNLTLEQVSRMFGISTQSVSYWAKSRDPHLYNISKSCNRKLLMAQDILEVRPNIRRTELATLVDVHSSTIDLWQREGKIELDVVCEICGEPASKKYCTSCTDKGWGVYATRYNMTLTDLQQMPTQCEICGSEEQLCIDHDHDTGKYRGVLCHGCNVSLGLLKEKIPTLENAIKYLKQNKIEKEIEINK